MERGHITPLADLSSKIVFDYWVSATGSGDGLTSTDPMSVEKMVGMMPSSSSLQADVYHLRGATFNFTEGTHSIENTITIPAYTGPLGYIAQIDGNGKAVLEGASVKVFDVKGNAVISNLTIQGNMADAIELLFRNNLWNLIPVDRFVIFHSNTPFKLYLSV